MLNDREIEQATAQLQEHRLRSDQYQKTQSDILERYRTLLEDYRRLKSDFEEERENRERYKQLAKGQDRNPFVLVLIDGDQNVFDDTFISAGVDGGARAAKALDEAVRRSLRTRGLDHCSVVVRGYANVSGLSKALSKERLCGAEKRAIAPFIASFNSTKESFDLVDAGESKENTSSKIRSVFRQFVDNPQCKHIFFAACHNAEYTPDLAAHTGRRSQVTLVHPHALDDEHTRLGLGFEGFPNVFRTTLANGEPPSLSRTHTTISPPATTHSSTPSVDLKNGTVCTFFQKNHCKYGNSCKFLHIKITSNGHSSSTFNLADLGDWRKDAAPHKASSVEMPSKMTIDEYLSQRSPDSMQDPVDFAAILPREEDILENQVPINKRGQRLDPYIPSPSHEDRAHFNARVARQKLCNNLQINGHCSQGPSCQYDHSAITEGMRFCLKQIAFANPCPRRGGCRSLTCVHAHICQKPDCKYRGGKAFCKIPPIAHQVDLNVAEYVQGTDASSKDSVSEHGTLQEENGTHGHDVSAKEEPTTSSTPPRSSSPEVWHQKEPDAENSVEPEPEPESEEQGISASSWSQQPQEQQQVAEPTEADSWWQQ